ncbi:hypothetical protein SLEP1_g59499, partial [Rubroshorea leprosula]
TDVSSSLVVSSERSASRSMLPGAMRYHLAAIVLPIGVVFLIMMSCPWYF